MATCESHASSLLDVLDDYLASAEAKKVGNKAVHITLRSGVRLANIVEVTGWAKTGFVAARVQGVEDGFESHWVRAAAFDLIEFGVVERNV